MRNWLLLIKSLIVVLVIAQCVSPRHPEKQPSVISKDDKYNERPGNHVEAPGPMSSDSAKLDSIKNSKAKKRNQVEC